MGKSIGVVVGVVVLLMGALFFLQGIGVVVSSSPMTDTVLWTVLGPVIAVVGLVIIIVSSRGRRRPTR